MKNKFLCFPVHHEEHKKGTCALFCAAYKGETFEDILDCRNYGNTYLWNAHKCPIMWHQLFY